MISMAPQSLPGILSEASEAIRSIGAGNPRLEAELLLAHAIARPRVFLFTHPEYEPTAGERSRFQALLARRMASEPLQYVLGTADFRHLTLDVDPGVLIPRAETEVLVEHAWGALQRWDMRRGGRGPAPGRLPWVIDVGVGSGAILLALTFEALGLSRHQRAVSGRDLWFHPLAIDISVRALHLAGRNASRNGLPPPRLLLCDLLQAVDPRAPVAGIVSNPPYVATAEMAELPAEIREYEPHEALHGGADGLAALRDLLDQAIPFVRRGAFLCFEIGATQADAVELAVADRGLAAAARIFPDLAGRPRVVLIEATAGTESAR
jgi:release factor glutamine methyltransferase